MKRSSFGSEGTLQTGTSFPIASNSSDPRSFIIPNKALMASVAADAALMRQKVEQAEAIDPENGEGPSATVSPNKQLQSIKSHLINIL